MDQIDDGFEYLGFHQVRGALETKVDDGEAVGMTVDGCRILDGAVRDDGERCHGVDPHLVEQPGRGRLVGDDDDRCQRVVVGLDTSGEEGVGPSLLGDRVVRLLRPRAQVVGHFVPGCDQRDVAEVAHLSWRDIADHEHLERFGQGREREFDEHRSRHRSYHLLIAYQGNDSFRFEVQVELAAVIGPADRHQ
jgi:hypothetical protein